MPAAASRAVGSTPSLLPAATGTSSDAAAAGGNAAANSMLGANSYNPFGTAFAGAGQNKDFTAGIAKLFGNTNSMGNTVYNSNTMNPFTEYGQGAGSYLSGNSGSGG